MKNEELDEKIKNENEIISTAKLNFRKRESIENIQNKEKNLKKTF
jgi:hypothetical protein